MANRSLHLSGAFCISSGTVTLDLAQSDSKVLLIWWSKTGEYMLPKGRKNINKTHLKRQPCVKRSRRQAMRFTFSLSA
jgi:hypothetical protein